MPPTETLLMAVLALGGMVVLLWMLPAPCVCQHCAFHRHERAEKAARQRALNHDTEHKGFGFRDGAPDRFPCSDEECSRNP